jgi:Holliday junction resolvase RusA-like endonuclease
MDASTIDRPFGCPLDDPQQLEPVTVMLAGEPQGKGRARAVRRGNYIGHYTPEKTRTYEGMIRSAAMDALGNKAPFEDPVEFVLRAVFPVPTSWSCRKRQRALTGELKPGKKPDLDNIVKAWNDALNGVVYRDDALICRMTLDKRYGPQALVVVTVRPLP